MQSWSLIINMVVHYEIEDTLAYIGLATSKMCLNVGAFYITPKCILLRNDKS